MFPTTSPEQTQVTPLTVEMKVLLLSVLVAAVLTQPTSMAEKDHVLTQWHLFKIEHGKEYENEKEEVERLKIFTDNVEFVREHNMKYERGEVNFTVAINKFADLTAREFALRVNGFKHQKEVVDGGEVFEAPKDVNLPPTVDWRKKGAVTEIKDQGQCGSCWAFSATGSLEGQTFIKSKKLISLSEQNLVDCSTAEGNEGCNGGLMSRAFLYVKINRGIDTESSYPYEARDDSCRYNVRNKGATDSGYVKIPTGNELKLQAAVATVGPISVAIDASHSSFQMYKSGVYTEPRCSPQDLDHGVLAIGYGTVQRGGDYWLVKNSWGTGWGMQGYIMMARNKHNMCGIASMASYPSV